MMHEERMLPTKVRRLRAFREVVRWESAQGKAVEETRDGRRRIEPGADGGSR